MCKEQVYTEPFNFHSNSETVYIHNEDHIGHIANAPRPDLKTLTVNTLLKAPNVNHFLAALRSGLWPNLHTLKLVGMIGVSAIQLVAALQLGGTALINVEVSCWGSTDADVILDAVANPRFCPSLKLLVLSPATHDSLEKTKTLASSRPKLTITVV